MSFARLRDATTFGVSTAISVAQSTTVEPGFRHDYYVRLWQSLQAAFGFPADALELLTAPSRFDRRFSAALGTLKEARAAIFAFAEVGRGFLEGNPWQPHGRTLEAIETAMRWHDRRRDEPLADLAIVDRAICALFAVDPERRVTGAELRQKWRFVPITGAEYRAHFWDPDCEDDPESGPRP